MQSVVKQLESEQLFKIVMCRKWDNHKAGSTSEVRSLLKLCEEKATAREKMG